MELKFIIDLKIFKKLKKQIEYSKSELEQIDIVLQRLIKKMDSDNDSSSSTEVYSVASEFLSSSSNEKMADGDDLYGQYIQQMQQLQLSNTLAIEGLATHIQQVNNTPQIGKPPIFFGNEDVIEWTEKYSEYARTLRWADVTALDNMKTYLNDSALRWYRINYGSIAAGQRPTDLNNFLQSMKKFFDQAGTAEKTYSLRIQKPNESARDFILVKVDLNRQLGYR